MAIEPLEEGGYSTTICLEELTAVIKYRRTVGVRFEIPAGHFPNKNQHTVTRLLQINKKYFPIILASTTRTHTITPRI
jgi:hypothetical protein